jgi:hypothetical protein
VRAHESLVCVALCCGGCHFGVSYSSEWTSVHSKSDVEQGDGDYTGSTRTNVITISDDTGWLRAGAIAAGSVSEEVTRRENEANHNGGYYHREDISIPAAVPGGTTRVAIGWGDNGAWKRKFVSYTDSIAPRPFGDSGMYWSIEADVVMGTLEHDTWLDGSEFEFRAQVGPVFGKQLGSMFGLDLSAHVGLLIDPVFKPVAGLLLDTPILDVTTYVAVDAVAAGHVTIGARAAYDRGQMLVESSAGTITATAGVVF